MILLVLLVISVGLATARLVRLIWTDGLGGNPRPRSHAAELGSWVDSELRR